MNLNNLYNLENAERLARQYPFLTAEEERELVIRYQKNGDEEALERLVLSNLRFVLKAALTYRDSTYYTTTEDLFQEGVFGFIHGIKLFNPNRGVRLLTYAGYWVYHAIQRAVERDTLISVPIEKMRLYRKSKSARYSDKMTEKERRQIKGIEMPFYLEEMFIRDDKDEGADRFLGYDDANFALTELRHDLERAMDCLDPEEYIAISLRDGLTIHGEMTIRRAAEEMGVSEKTFKSIYKRARQKMRWKLRHYAPARV